MLPLRSATRPHSHATCARSRAVDRGTQAASDPALHGPSPLREVGDDAPDDVGRLRHNHAAKGAQAVDPMCGRRPYPLSLPGFLRRLAARGPAGSVQPTGKPWSCSAHSGFNRTAFPSPSTIETADTRSFPDQPFVTDRILWSDAVGVGQPPDGKDSVAGVRSANAGSGYSEPDRIIPARGKVSEYGGDGGLLDDAPSVVANGRSSARDVLPHREPGPKLANDARLFVPETARLTSETSAVASVRQILAGTPAADEVDGGEVVRADGSHVVMSNSVGPVFL